MRQPDCFIVNGAIVLIMWLMQWGTLFSGDSSEAFRSEDVRRHCCWVNYATCLLDRH